MDKKRNLGIVGGIVALGLIVLFVGIVYAGYNQDLTINGSGTVKLSSWKILFTNVSAPNLGGTAKQVTPPGITATKIGDYAVTLTTPGDSVSYEITVRNDGTFDAEISSITIPTPTCTGSGENAETDAANVCKYLTYTLQNKPAEPEEGEEPEEATPVQVGDALGAQQEKVFILTLTYGSTITSSELPKNDVTISNLSIPIIYSQS